MFQMANIGPMLGQAHHFRHYANENIQYAINRYTNEASKIYAVLDAQRKHSILRGRITVSLILQFTLG